MSNGNAIDNTLISPFLLGSTSITTTGDQLNLLNALSTFPIFTKISVTQFFSAGSFTYTKTAGTQYAIFELQGGGGGSGGSTGAAGQTGIGIGGGGGAYMQLLVSGTNLNSITGIVGNLGSAGAPGNFPGGDGLDTTLTINGGTTWIAKGGKGGAGGTASASAFVTGISDIAVPTNGTNATLIFSIIGGSSQPGFASNSGALPYRGSQGGKSFFSMYNNTTTFTNGLFYGGGASTSVNVSGANAAGHTGGTGIVVITEFISS